MHRHTDAARGRYLEKIMAMMQQGELPEVGVHQADVYHDTWCGIWAGRACDCEPQIRVREVQHEHRSGHS